MNRLPLIVAGLVGLVAGGVVGAVALGGDTETKTEPTVVTELKTQTKTVRRGAGRGANGAAQAPRVVTRTQTVTVPENPSAGPGETGGGGPTRTVSGTQTFTGKDFKQFGTLKLKRTSTMRWTNTGNVFSAISQTALHISSTKKKGQVTMYKGSYPQFRIAAIGRWKFTLTPR
jgi:hypothetical protein